MLEGLPLGLLDGIGVVGAVLLFALGLGTGRLFTRRQYDDVQHDRNEWRTECRLKDQQIVEKDEQIATKDRQLSHLAEVGATMRHVLTAIQRLSGTHEEAPR